MTSVFVSYSKKDEDFVIDELLPRLRAGGLEPWYDANDIRVADEWERKIREGLVSCEWFLVVLSSNSVTSDWVRTEVHWALENRKARVIPVLVDRCDPADLHLKLSQIQYIDLRDRRETAWQELMKIWPATAGSTRSRARDSKSKLTLWFLNRITQWEEERSGELAAALSGRHDVKLGRRVEKSKNDVPGVVELIVNELEPSFIGELMHEGRQQKRDGMRSSYDEYFVPIPLKCIGKPKYEAGKPQLTDFWKQLIPSDKHEEFLAILDPDRSRNDCFSPKHVDTYWQGWRPVRGDSDLANEFSDVRMNTRPDEKIGYYQILQQAKAAHGDNILIGYSQGGVVAQYLAYLDEHFVPREKRCIRGVICVQAPLRGSTLAMQSRQQDVLDSLVHVLHALWDQTLLGVLRVPSHILAHVEPMLAPGHKLTLEEVITTLDLLFHLAKRESVERLVLRGAAQPSHVQFRGRLRHFRASTTPAHRRQVVLTIVECWAWYTPAGFAQKVKDGRS